MKKIKINSTLVILIAILFCLFSGHFIYQNKFVENPIRREIQAIPNVAVENITIQPKNVKIIVRPSIDFSWSDYTIIRNKVQRYAGNRTIDLQLLDLPDQYVRQAWQQMVFSVRENIATQRFTEINKTVKGVAKKKKIKSEIVLEENDLFIKLYHGNNFLIRVYALDKIQDIAKNNND